MNENNAERLSENITGAQRYQVEDLLAKLPSLREKTEEVFAPNLHDFVTLDIVATVVASSNRYGYLWIFITNGSIINDEITRVESLATSLNVGFPGKNVMRP